MSGEFHRRKAYKYVGTYRPRIDGWEKASGKTEFIDDITLSSCFPGLLYAKVLRSPYPHARIKDLNLSKAEQLPGVKCVITYKDPEIARLKMTNASWTDGVDTVSYDRMMWRHLRDRQVLSEHVCWVGDEAGVMVVAESEQIAEEALRLIDIDWEIFPFVLDPIEAMKPGAPVIHPEINAYSNKFPIDPTSESDVFIEKGDVERGFADADVVIETNSTHHNNIQAAFDNWCCLAEWKGDKLAIWSNSYEADQTRMHISQMLNIPINRVRVISPFVGGSHGRSDNGDQPFFLFTAIAASRTGRPVKFKHTRRESFHDTRQPVLYYCKMGAKKDGTITACYSKGIGNAGAYADSSLFALKYAPAELAEVLLAHIPNLKMEVCGVYTNVIPACMMRGVGNIQYNFMLGLAVDVLAEKLSIDPLELTIKNFGHKWEKLPDESLKAVLQEGAKRIGWEKRHKAGMGPVYGDGNKRGIGFSFHAGWHAEWQEVRRGHVQVGIILNPDCTVTLEAPTVETGPGSNVCNILGCAEALDFLGVQPEDITWASTVDTESGYKDTVQTDSSVSFLQSELMPLAAAEIKAKILQLAAQHFNVKPEELDIESGNIYVKATSENKMMVKDLLMSQSDLIPIISIISKVPDDTITGIPFLATFAEVEVDTATGKVTVLKVVILNDCGTVMYASGAEAQQLGGQCIAIGETLTEEIIYDEASGVPLNFNWIDYKIPTMADVSEVEPVLMEVWKGSGKYGACGIGESVVTCTPRAIANAIYNAIGVRIDEIPIKPEKVLKALGKNTR